MKEVKLKIDVGKIIRECEVINSIDEMYNAVSVDNKVSDLAILDRILDGNIRIESKHADEKEELQILNVIKNEIREHFVYYDSELNSICNVRRVIVDGRIDVVKFWALVLINNIIRANPFVYNAEHGICRKDGIDLTQDVDPYNENCYISTRAYTLQVDDAKMESALYLTSESLERQNFCYISGLASSMDINILKKYTFTETHYTLDELYTLTKDNGVPLVDYGLKLIYEKYFEMGELFELVKNIKLISNSLQDVTREIYELFSPEDLKIIVSIRDNLEKIKYEKTAHNCLIRSLEYMANNTPLVDAKDGTRLLKISSDLSDFSIDYVAGRKGLRRIVDKEKAKLDEELKRVYKTYNAKCDRNRTLGMYLFALETGSRVKDQSYYQAEEKIKKEKESAVCAINRLKNDIALLKWKIRKEELQRENIHKLLSISRSLSQMSLAQQDYIIRKIEEFGKAHNIKVEVVEIKKLLSIRLTRANIVKMFILSAMLIVASLLLVRYMNSEVKSVGTS
ncbi:hypothetical protein NEMIN01_2291 [Nematocida minor]|uniref:uncharacterized protein n=1 Tax=Nematocida minor TaxID=1912983 RepID=UPI002220D25C|nr:uncharacterized protein NEMIN01_2291 [Nematocida minor]KAI5192921.1 hypothetical protein NEMIN01_2291 [Nematocida minor]